MALAFAPQTAKAQTIFLSQFSISAGAPNQGDSLSTPITPGSGFILTVQLNNAGVGSFQSGHWLQFYLDENTEGPGNEFMIRICSDEIYLGITNSTGTIFYYWIICEPTSNSIIDFVYQPDAYYQLILDGQEIWSLSAVNANFDAPLSYYRATNAETAGSASFGVIGSPGAGSSIQLTLSIDTGFGSIWWSDNPYTIGGNFTVLSGPIGYTSWTIGAGQAVYVNTLPAPNYFFNYYVFENTSNIDIAQPDGNAPLILPPSEIAVSNGAAHIVGQNLDTTRFTVVEDSESGQLWIFGNDGAYGSLIWLSSNNDFWVYAGFTQNNLYSNETNSGNPIYVTPTPMPTYAPGGSGGITPDQGTAAIAAGMAFVTVWLVPLIIVFSPGLLLAKYLGVPGLVVGLLIGVVIGVVVGYISAWAVVVCLIGMVAVLVGRQPAASAVIRGGREDDYEEAPPPGEEE